MQYQLNRLFALALVALLAGCSSTGDTQEGADVEDRGTEGVETSGAAGAGSFSGASLDDPNSPLSRRVIYFEYDSSEFLADDQELVAAHAAYLADNPNQMITLEGHGDERGSREYNIGLGDRRAQSVRRVFELQGVSPQQISIVSYGEEKPAAEGHSDAAWRLNRRVEIVYTSY
ncbi:MAG: peptidoglycan-associated lipoprotein Pal [Thiohalobacterales bacterium]